MRQILKHIVSQPFIASTAFAALLHSTWSLGTLFAGVQPSAGFNFEFIGWLTPALLIAFSLDIGLLATAGEIRAGQRTRAKYLTFAILALAMFYCQWVYLIAHTPALALAPGVSPTWAGIALTLRDAAIWIIPALLPLSTLLYTFSHTAPAGQGRTVGYQNGDARRQVLVDGMDGDTTETALVSPNGHSQESASGFLGKVRIGKRNRKAGR